jgi:hypothetical protein
MAFITPYFQINLYLIKLLIFGVIKSRRNRWAAIVAWGTSRVLVEISNGKGRLERHRRRCESNIKVFLQEGYGKAWTVMIWLKIRTGCRFL